MLFYVILLVAVLLNLVRVYEDLSVTNKNRKINVQCFPLIETPDIVTNCLL